jgi:hypothetical protein
MVPQGSVFTSYVPEDQGRVQPLAKYLSAKDFDVWLDTEGIDPDGQAFANAACVLVVWTTNSVRANSVLSQASQGLEKGNIAPVLLDSNAQIPVGFTKLKNVDLTNWDGSEDPALLELTARIRRLVERGPAKRAFYGTQEARDWVIQDSQNAVSELNDQTSRIRYIRGILKPDSDQARNVRNALDQVGKTYYAVNSAIGRFIHAGIRAPIDDEAFTELEGDTLNKSIRDGKGNCDQILTYYGTVDGPRDWIKDKISPEELKQVDEAFKILGRADDELFERLARIGYVLTGESNAILRLFILGQQREARQRAINDRKFLEPVREKLSHAIQALEKLQGSFGYAGSV